MAGCVTRTHTVTTAPPGPSVADIEAMAQAHVSDAVIMSQIQTSPTRYVLTGQQIIDLKNAGVSDAVTTAMINSAQKPVVQSATTTEIEGHYVYPYVYVDPWPWGWWGWGPHYYGGFHGCYYRGGGGFRRGR